MADDVTLPVERFFAFPYRQEAHNDPCIYMKLYNKPLTADTYRYHEAVLQADWEQFQEAAITEIRTLEKLNTWHDFQNSNTILHDGGDDIMGSSETNINWIPSDENTVKAMYKDTYKYSILSTSNISELPGSPDQQGRTATIITNKLTGRVVGN